jgi:hypothetical protein
MEFIMIEQIFNFLHVAPLAVIAFIIAKQVFTGASKSVFNANDTLMLVLSSVGILAGTYDHHHAHFAVDPCVGYSIVLGYVAFRSIRKKVLQSISNK